MPRASALLLLLPLLACAPEAPGPPSVVLVTLDTTRVDHLSCYGYERETTPHLDALAARGVRYLRAWSTSSWTLPAHASLFTGLYPSYHGAHYDARGGAVLGDVVRMRIAKHVRAGRLPEERTTLAELLRERGYRTGAFVAGPWLHRSFGLLQGFEATDDDVTHLGGRPAREVTDAALRWLAGLPEDNPYFLFANYFDPHAPYAPKGRYADLPLAHAPFEPDHDAVMRGDAPLGERERAVLRDRYDAEIREMDAELGRLLEAVLGGSRGERTLVVVTADHGEALGDEGRFGHGFWLSEELLRVPLVVRHPGDRGAGTTSDVAVQLVDVLPMVAAELGLPVPDEAQGVAPGGRQVALAELFREATTVARFGQSYDRDLRVAIAWPWKLERSDRGGERFLRMEDGNVHEAPADAPDEVRRALAEALGAHAEGAPELETVAPDVDEDTVEALRQLGYVD